MTYKMCIIIKLLMPPLNAYPLPFRFSTENLKSVISSFTNSKHRVFISQPTSPPF